MHGSNVRIEHTSFGSEGDGARSEALQSIRGSKAMWINEEQTEVQSLQHQMGGLLSVLRHEKELVLAGESAAECEWRRRADVESRLYRCLRELSRVEGERDAAILTTHLLRINHYNESDSEGNCYEEQYTSKADVMLLRRFEGRP